MAHSDFSITITDDSVDVRYTPSGSEPRGKLIGFISLICLVTVFACAVLFIPAAHGTESIWQDLASAPLISADFIWPLIAFLVIVGFIGWWGFWYGRAAWPSDETFHCDREAITISRVPWTDFKNRTWRTQRYPLSEVSAIRYAVIASAKGQSYRGLRFKAFGRKWALPGLEAPEAKTILAGLRALGADVPDDPSLDKRIKETLETRDGSTDWMDRSWMDADKQ